MSSSGLFGDWQRLDSFLANAPSRLRAASDRASGRAGALLSKRIKEGIRSQKPGGRSFEKLSDITLARKSGTKALIDSGTLLRSVTWKKVSRGVWVGCNRRDKSGKYNLAKVHEFGATIKIGDKEIRIPARPFIGPVISDPDIQQEVVDEYVRTVREALRP